MKNHWKFHSFGRCQASTHDTQCCSAVFQTIRFMSDDDLHRCIMVSPWWAKRPATTVGEYHIHWQCFFSTIPTAYRLACLAIFCSSTVQPCFFFFLIIYPVSFRNWNRWLFKWCSGLSNKAIQRLHYIWMNLSDSHWCIALSLCPRSLEEDIIAMSSTCRLGATQTLPKIWEVQWNQRLTLELFFFFKVCMSMFFCVCFLL